MCESGGSWDGYIVVEEKYIYECIMIGVTKNITKSE
jgi:hypothetical protein